MALRLPFHRAHEAPAFDGTPLTLTRFFQDVDNVYIDCAVAAPTDAEKIRWTIYYLDPNTADLWETVTPNRATMTWDEFKKKIQELYPGSDRSRLYSARDLENIVADYGERGVYTRADLGEYYREFERISGYLLAHGKTDQAACNRLYIQGFGDATRRRIEQRLQIVLL
jgi:hypothetical protein